MPLGIDTTETTPATAFTSVSSASDTAWDAGTGSNRALFIHASISTGATPAAPTSVTFNGVAATLIDGALHNTYGYNTLYKMVEAAPLATGIHTLTATWAAAHDEVSLGARVLTSVDQTTPHAAAQMTTAASSTAISNTYAAGAVDDIIIDAVYVIQLSGGSPVLTAGAGQSQQYQVTPSVYAVAGMSTEAGASSVAMSWSISITSEWHSIAIAVKPSAGGAAAALAGAAAAVVSAAGALTTSVGLVGASIAVASAGGTLSTGIPMGGVAQAVHAATGALTGGSVPNAALEFPTNVSGSDTAAPLVALKYANPHSNGLPSAGPANAGATYIWRIRYVQQTGYYVCFWWGQGDAGFDPAKAYYGGHPYPTTANNTGTDHNWEIAGGGGGDFQVTRGGGVKAVVKSEWFTQGLRVDYNAGVPKLIFYTALPSVANADVIEIDFPSGNLDAANNPPSPIMMIGDSPWYAGYQHERLGGRFAKMKMIAKLLSEADMLSEAANLDSLVTTDGQASIWWGKKNFGSVDDLTCDFGTARSFVWADTANKATLWVNPEISLAGTATVSVAATGELSASIKLNGAALAQALAAAGLTTAINLAGQAAGVVNATGALVEQAAALAGAAAASPLAAAALDAQIQMLGSAAQIAAATGSLTATIRLDGAALAAALGAGDLTTSPQGLSGAATARAVAGGALTTAIPVIGAAASVVSAAGDLVAQIRLLGASASVATAVGSLDVVLALNGAALAQVLAGGDLTAQVRLNGVAVARALASGSLSGGSYARPHTTRTTRVRKVIRRMAA